MRGKKGKATGLGAIRVLYLFILLAILQMKQQCEAQSDIIVDNKQLNNTQTETIGFNIYAPIILTGSGLFGIPLALASCNNPPSCCSNRNLQVSGYFIIFVSLVATYIYKSVYSFYGTILLLEEELLGKAPVWSSSDVPILAMGAVVSLYTALWTVFVGSLLFDEKFNPFFKEALDPWLSKRFKDYTKFFKLIRCRFIPFSGLYAILEWVEFFPIYLQLSLQVKNRLALKSYIGLDIAIAAFLAATNAMEEFFVMQPKLENRFQEYLKKNIQNSDAPGGLFLCSGFLCTGCFRLLPYETAMKLTILCPMFLDGLVIGMGSVPQSLCMFVVSFFSMLFTIPIFLLFLQHPRALPLAFTPVAILTDLLEVFGGISLENMSLVPFAILFFLHARILPAMSMVLYRLNSGKNIHDSKHYKLAVLVWSCLCKAALTTSFSYRAINIGTSQGNFSVNSTEQDEPTQGMLFSAIVYFFLVAILMELVKHQISKQLENDERDNRSISESVTMLSSSSIRDDGSSVYESINSDDEFSEPRSVTRSITGSMDVSRPRQIARASNVGFLAKKIERFEGKSHVIDV